VRKLSKAALICVFVLSPKSPIRTLMRKWIRRRRHSGKSRKRKSPMPKPLPEIWRGHRSSILNEQPRGQLGARDDLAKNADGSVDIYWGPTSPKGFEKNWIQTVPGKAWFVGFRFYAPTEAYFEKSWPLPDVEKLK
jgi:hypothetical protein